MTLSKHLYTKGIQCSKLLWLQQYNKKVLEKKDYNSLANIEIDNEIKALAYELFSNGIEIPNISDKSEMLSLTEQNINNNVKTIYNATFTYDEIIVTIDILTIKKDGISLYHIENSAFTDTVTLHTLCLQYYVLQKLGYEIKTINSITLNRLYIRGNDLDIKKLFCINDLTEKIFQLENSTQRNIEHFKKILANEENEPNIDIGKHCESHNSCEAKEYCWKVQKKIPEYSIFNIFKLGSKKQKQLYSKGIVKIEDIPQSFWMTEKQAKAVEHYKLQDIYTNKEAIKKFLDTLNYPIYHFSCKTFHHAVPNFKESNPYEEIPFQYSIHIEHQDGTIEHKEYLSPDEIDPRYEFIKNLCKDIPKDVTVLGYDISEIQNILKNLAYPYSARSEHLLKITKNMKELMLPFEQKHLVSSSMMGSSDKKDILQSLLPEVASSYSKFEELNTDKKVLHLFPKLNTIEQSKKEEIRTNLKEYLKLESLSILKILEKLKEV